MQHRTQIFKYNVPQAKSLRNQVLLLVLVLEKEHVCYIKPTADTLKFHVTDIGKYRLKTNPGESDLIVYILPKPQHLRER